MVLGASIQPNTVGSATSARDQGQKARNLQEQPQHMSVFGSDPAQGLSRGDIHLSKSGVKLGKAERGEKRGGGNTGMKSGHGVPNVGSTISQKNDGSREATRRERKLSVLGSLHEQADHSG